MHEPQTAARSGEKLLLTREDCAQLLSCSVRTIDTMLANGELPSRRIGRRRLVPRAALEQFARRDHTTGREKKGAP